MGVWIESIVQPLGRLLPENQGIVVATGEIRERAKIKVNVGVVKID